MKKALFLLVIIVAFSLLSACSAIQGGATSGAGRGTAAGASAPGGNQEQTLPLAMKLALGILKLEDTKQPISAEQATAMLPLWKALRSLGGNQTTAAEELQAVVSQIQGTLTSEQMSAIDAMQLSYRDMQTIAQERGIQLGGGGGFGNLSPEARATFQAARQNGGGFQGGGNFGGGQPPFEGGPGGGGGQGGVNPEARQTAVARNGSFSNSSLGVPTALLDGIITFLDGKAGVPTATPAPNG
jgi:hypothetical protein